jgi:hypothetical protein
MQIAPERVNLREMSDAVASPPRNRDKANRTRWQIVSIVFVPSVTGGKFLVGTSCNLYEFGAQRRGCPRRWE